MEHSYYLKAIFNREHQKTVVKKLEEKIKKLKEQGVKIDAVAFCGQSGAGIVYPFFYKTGFPILCVRKKNESPHGYHVESSESHGIEYYVIVDDLIDTGKTINYITDVLSNYAECSGIILYQSLWVSEFNNIPVHYIGEERS